jgi:hypothetical protein
MPRERTRRGCACQGTHEAPSAFGELGSHDRELVVLGQEELDVRTLVHDGRDASFLGAEIERVLVLFRRAERLQPRGGDAELVHQVALREGADLEPDGLVAGDQAVDALDRGRQSLHGEYGRQAGGVAGLDDQDYEQPDYEHETPQRAPRVLSCGNTRCGTTRLFISLRLSPVSSSGM